MDRAMSLAKLHDRLERLRSQPKDTADAFAGDDLEDLANALEQLRLADEAAIAQNVELKAARDTLDAERSRYRELFELAPDPYVMTDSHGLISEANRAAVKLLGLDRCFLLRKPLQVFIPRDERFAFRQRVRDLKDWDGSIEWRLRIRPRGRAVLHVSASVAVIPGRHGETSGLRWCIRDITARVREEDQLRDVNAELERRVKDRTAALEIANRLQDDLLQRERAAREAAERANRIKDEFLATLSHELRTPLNVVLGWIFRLRHDAVDAEQRDKALETIERNAREQFRLVEDLLDTARIANGRLQLELQTVELASIVHGAVESVEATAEAREIRIDPHLDCGAQVRGDPERLRQIVWNLLVNALKFSPVGGTVSVDVGVEDDRASIAVRDNGSGIPSDVMPHIFERFWQAEHSTTRSRGGLGLGLAIVKHLVEMHGGEIEAQSDGPGKGATFTVRLPLLDAAKNRGVYVQS
jgi:PAS domain S-box-containing protein